MSFPPNFLDKTLPEAEAGQAAAGRPVSARRALLVWIVLMLATWLLLGAGIYAFLESRAFSRRAMSLSDAGRWNGVSFLGNSTNIDPQPILKAPHPSRFPGARSASLKDRQR